MNPESADGSSNFEIKAESEITEYEYFDDYLKAVLNNKISSRHRLREKGTAWDIYEYEESNQLSSVSMYGFDNAIVSKFRNTFKGTCRLYELDDALVRFSLYSINKASEESGYKKLIDIMNNMSDYVPIYNDIEVYDLNNGITLAGNKKLILNVRMPTKAEFEIMSVDLMLDKSSLAKTCYWYATISTKIIAENTEWVRDNVFKKYDEANSVLFMSDEIHPYSVLMHDFDLKKRSLKKLVFRWVPKIIDNYRLSILDYKDDKLDDNAKRRLLEKYKILRKIIRISSKKDEKLRGMLNSDIDVIKAVENGLKNNSI